MKVLSLNVNGIRSSWAKGLGGVLAEEDPDVACLQEVRAAEDVLPALLPGRRGFWHPARKPGYSGVGLLSRWEPDDVVRGMGIGTFDSEGRVLLARFGELRVVSVYVPSGVSGTERQAFKMSFLDAFLRYVAGLLDAGGQLLLCGDFNIAHRPIDLRNWRSNQKTSGFLPEERAWLDQLLAAGLCDVVRELIGEKELYSWWSMRSGARSRNVGWRLDYHFATPALRRAACSPRIPREPFLSDHAPVIVDYAT